jgi:hypothetical protein
VSALSKVKHARMREALVGILSGCYAAFAALQVYCSRFDEDTRFSAAGVITLGFLALLMMAFPLFLNLSHPF